MFMASRILRESWWFSWPTIFTLVQSIEWPASLACSADVHLAQVPSFLVVSPMSALPAVTILAFDIVNDSTFLLNRDLTF